MNDKARKLHDLHDELTGAFCAVCMLYGIKTDSPAFKEIKRLLDELEELLECQK